MYIIIMGIYHGKFIVGKVTFKSMLQKCLAIKACSGTASKSEVCSDSRLVS